MKIFSFVLAVASAISKLTISQLIGGTDRPRIFWYLKVSHDFKVPWKVFKSAQLVLKKMISQQQHVITDATINHKIFLICLQILEATEWHTVEWWKEVIYPGLRTIYFSRIKSVFTSQALGRLNQIIIFNAHKARNK